MNAPPPAPPADAPPSDPPARGMRGWKVVLVFLVLAPAVIVPLLLAGPAMERQACLRALDQREAEFFQVASTRLSALEWQSIDEWPEWSGRYEIPAALRTPPEALPPSEFAALAYGPDAERQWVTIQRSLPFAYFAPVRNLRALRPERLDIMDIRLVAATVLDPRDPDDRAVLAELDRVLSEGFQEAEDLPMREKRRRDPMPGEMAARYLLNSLFTALADAEDPRAAARGVLADPRRATPMPGLGGVVANDGG